MSENKKVGMNEQDAPRKEGQYGNTSANPAAEENISMGTSQMKQPSEEQLRGREKRRDEGGQANERPESE